MAARVYTDEYNIAPLLATVPVSIFTLNMKEYTDNYTIPTFFMLHRPKAWHYESLPDNVYPLPIASDYEITTYVSRNRMYNLVAAWVKELYDLNNASVFHFYLNDRWVEGCLQATLQNGIGYENFDLTLLSDGTGSYEDFNSLYNNANAAANYTKYTAEWNAILSSATMMMIATR